ncbi:Uncharacterized membrane protein YhaH, DUF805 family [Pseudoxanthobacter soli DSM 19599]|uniref:Uncharacterized membrane protein YhaH, DUF805 family n=1 Tax=Pseudoxanthobacter soli DSM 19599 TaxID=1123029 RepID=A0A1M7ZMN9_9HYPH|nr:DUF805 domain-containing protein [Pseudoxanthobacter soli]SHO66082.1 Uncharacterized membrane protein YhaH, DUF805 family [Pseudoxanthobacter soli DSM 19599]
MAHPPTNASRETSILWLLFSFDGRIGREPFFLGFVLITLVEVVLMSPMRGEIQELIAQPNLPFLVIIGIALWTEFALAVKRLHDRGYSALFSLILFIPFVNFIFFFLVLALVPGDAGPNRYGPSANSRPR